MKKRDKIEPSSALIIPPEAAPFVEEPVVEESPPVVQRFDPISDDEIAEYQRYWIELEVGSGGHRPDISIQAGQALILIEILKELKEQRGKK
jgi:hypothetical protein